MLPTTVPSDSPPKRLGGATGHGWMPGVSGNPSGRGKVTPHEREALQLARTKAPWAIRKLIAMAENRVGKYSETTELAATNSLLDRALGRPGVRNGVDLGGVTFKVVQLAVPAAPVAGVICSPVEEHVCAPRLVSSSGEVVDSEG